MDRVLYEVRTAHARTTDFGQMVVGAREKRPSGIYGAISGRDDPTIVVVSLYGTDSPMTVPSHGLVNSYGLIVPSEEMVIPFVEGIAPELRTVCTNEIDELMEQVVLGLDWMQSFMRSPVGCRMEVEPYGEPTVATDLLLLACSNWAQG